MQSPEIIRPGPSCIVNVADKLALHCDPTTIKIIHDEPSGRGYAVIPMQDVPLLALGLLGGLLDVGQSEVSPAFVGLLRGAVARLEMIGLPTDARRCGRTS